jgi:hypothetical protein
MLFASATMLAACSGVHIDAVNYIVVSINNLMVGLYYIPTNLASRLPELNELARDLNYSFSNQGRMVLLGNILFQRIYGEGDLLSAFPT